MKHLNFLFILCASAVLCETLPAQQASLPGTTPLTAEGDLSAQMVAGIHTWPVKRLVYEPASAYSSMVAGRPGTSTEGLIFLLFEGGPNGRYSAMQLARFNLSWILEGERTGDGEVPVWARPPTEA